MSDTMPSTPSLPATTKPAVTNDRVATTIDIAASPERVFAALTDPQELAAWWGSETGYRTRDWRADVRPEGEWSARTIDPSGKEGSIRGVYTVVDPPNSLESTWHASWDDDVVTTVRYELSPTVIDDAPGTRLTVTHTGFNGFVACAGATHGTALGELLAIGARSVIMRRPTACAV